MRTFDNIQGLRLVAAASVVLYHSDGFYFAMRGVPISQTFEYVGYAGVDIFFAISGAVMVLSTAKRVAAASSARFLYARFARIVPIYWILLALMWVVAWFWHRDYLQTISIRDAVLLWPINSYFLPPAWTLTYEMIFYAMFAGLLLLPFSWRGPAVAVMAGATVLICATSGTRSLHPFLSVIFFLEFFGGCTAAFLWLATGGRGWQWAIAVAAAMVGVAVIIQSMRHTSFGSVEWQRVLAFGPASALLIYGLLGCETRWRAIFPHPIVHAGDWSYSVYLFHPIALSFLTAMDPVHVLNTSRPVRTATVTLAVALILAISFAISAWVELPLYAALKALPLRLKSVLQEAGSNIRPDRLRPRPSSA